MSLPTAGKIYHAFTNGPAYRPRRNGEDNVIDFSSFRQLHARFSSRNFSIKYVLNGKERYNVNSSSYQVGSGRYLLTNAFTSGEVVIDSNENVNGICIELSPELLAEVSAIHHNPSSPFPEKNFFDFLTTADFFEHEYEASETNLGQYLQQATPRLSSGAVTDGLYLEQFFYGLAEKMLTDQREVYKYFCSFGRVRSSTRKDLLSRLLKGKEMMDDMYSEKISISEIARAATMSEYYFLRLFSNTFKCSPHRYLVEKRLQNAATLLLQEQESIVSIAYRCGFSDIYTFSKTFKKRFGRNPSEARLSGKGLL